ncbi:O-antigen ligase family protein [Coxiella burnetii]|uniref:O-antigen ligase family protein n=1 Tax=Coxiella burnetii TaxID=777 RepID=UPI000183CF11|nr:O-antigen ligase family protein [Coxiella burnetii]ACJ19649.1 O-antigen ligase [Coxiella burnetii CbuK_Q154]ATN85304.1 ligase [Coxiella burnetii str. Schperling]EAX33106.2 ligase [Coxiella burnetii 'MSU Goat Q177']PHH57481.1 O-antigen ligase domain-containing protein [Coxiella burnetii]UYK69374.1 O-antigen ligase family protein [Coxiella burnetii]
MCIREEIMQEAYKLRYQRVRKTTGVLLAATAFSVPLSTTATCILFPLATLLSLFSDPWHKKWRAISSHPVAIVLILFIALYVIAAFYSVAPNRDIFHQFSKTSNLLCAVILIGFSCEPPWRRYILNAFLIAMTITLGLSYIKYFFNPLLFFSTPFGKSSVFKDHIIQNFLMVITAFIFLYRSLTPVAPTFKLRTPNKWLNRWIYGILAFAAIFNALFINDGRSGYFIFAALLFFSGGLYFGWRGFLVALIMAVLLSGLAYHFSDQFRWRITELVQNTERYQKGEANTSVGIRIQSIKNAYVLFKQRPWLGHGTGGFHTAYATLPPEKTQATGDMRLSYNSYLNVGIELGIVGVFLLLMNFLIQWKYSYSLSGDYRYFMQALLIGMVIGCLGNSWLSDTTELHLYALFLGVAFSEMAARRAAWTGKPEEKLRSFQAA